MRFQLLGPVRAWYDDGSPVALGRRRDRAVLSLLLLDPQAVVPAYRIVELLWQRPASDSIIHQLRISISRLRRCLQPGDTGQERVQIVATAGGYLIETPPQQVDLQRFASLVIQAQQETDAQRRLQLADDSLGLWRGPLMADVIDDSLRERIGKNSQELWLSAVEARADAHIALQQFDAVTAVLADVIRRYPLHERFIGQMMLALGRSGRKPEALQLYEQHRTRLAQDLGVDPEQELQQLHQSLLRGEIDRPVSLAGVPDTVDAHAPLTAERTLPADVPGFVGRRDEMRKLLAAVETAAAGPAQAIAIHAVDGMAGVGKTAFAVHAAHHLAPGFPDGQRFVDLRAHAPGQLPVEPVDALEILLQADGVAAPQVPAGLDARAGLWRERVAGKRMLLVLDDAADQAHVAPLLPAAPQCLVLITSRRKLATLPGVSLLALDALPADDAATLFIYRAGVRARRDDPAVARIARLCGYLPLAITLTAARLHTHPTWTVAELADDLANAHDRLDELASGDLAVAAAIDLSYRDLPTDRQRLFRRLGLHPGRDFDAFTAAAVDDSSTTATRRRLEGLLEHNLLTEPHRGRYRFHDLIAAHSRTLSSSDPEHDREAATDRLLTYYQDAASHAASLQNSTEPVDRPADGLPPIGDSQQATDWLAAEQTNLVAVTMLADARRHPAAVAVPAALYEHLRHRGPFDLAIRLHDVAVTAARRTGDRKAEARALLNLAYMRYLASDYPPALADAETARDLYRQMEDPAGQARALATLASIRYLTSDFPNAATASEQANVLYQQVGDSAGQADALLRLAHVHLTTGNLSATASSAAHALTLYEQISDRRGQADALDTLARVHRLTGDNVAALSAAEHAQALFQQVGNRRGQANALQILAHLQHVVGDNITAATTAERARTIYQQIGNLDGLTFALRTLARVQLETGDQRAASATVEQALTISRQLRDQWGQGSALQIRGTVRHTAGDLPAAAADLGLALDLFRELGDPECEAETLNCIGRLELDTARVSSARQHFAAALDIARRIRIPSHEGGALEGIGRCLSRQGERDDAGQHLRDALDIYQRMGSPNTSRVQTALLHLTAGL